MALGTLRTSQLSGLLPAWWCINNTVVLLLSPPGANAPSLPLRDEYDDMIGGDGWVDKRLLKQCKLIERRNIMDK